MLIRRLHVRVRPDDRAHSTIEKTPHRNLFRGRLRMHIHENDRRLLSQLIHRCIGGIKRVLDWFHESLPLQIQHTDRRQITNLLHTKTLPRCSLGIIFRSHKTGLVVEQRNDLALIP